jgi:hypothetical protein
MKVETTEEEFLREKHFSFTCGEGHTSTLEALALRNKLAPKKMEKLLSVCAKCNRRIPILNRLHEKFQGLRFQLISLDDDNINLVYKCHCGAESKSNTKSMFREDRTSVCLKCQNNENRADYEQIKKKFSDRGCELLITPEEYKNNKEKLRFRCVCGSESEIVHNDIKRGRLCMNCKSDRSRETSILLYGVDNPSKSNEIKDKIKQTNIDRHGVPYAQQNPEIHAKTEATCEEKYGVKWVFTLPEVYEKMVDRYGTKHFAQSDEMKRRMLDTYGVEHFVKSDEMRRIMVERYGAPHAMQCPEIFRKYQANAYKRRPYICPDGKTFMILGYEDICLTQIFEQEGHKILYAGEDPEIPVIKYNDKDGKEHCYYPDVYLPDENRIIEVKSTYLFLRDRERNIAKARETSKHFKFEFMIYNGKKQLIHRSLILEGSIVSQEGEELFTQEDLSDP